MSEVERLVNLLHLERKASRPFGAARSAGGRLPTVESCGFERGTAAHAKTRRKLEKAEHDRDRYARGGAAPQIFDLSRGGQPHRADLESRRDSNLIAMMRTQNKAEDAAAN